MLNLERYRMRLTPPRRITSFGVLVIACEEEGRSYLCVRPSHAAIPNPIFVR